MFALTVVFGPQATRWTLLYKTEEAASAATHLNGAMRDDFGQTLFVKPEDVHGILLENLDQSLQAHVEQTLHQTHIMAAADEAGRKDPALQRAMQQTRAAQMMRGNGGVPMVGPRIGS